jgi:hypothetical protein
MDIFIFFSWLLMSLGISAVILHKIGNYYGADVAMSGATWISVFMTVGTIVGLGIGFTRWWFL